MWKFDESNDFKARNRLSLLEKFEAIHAYEKTPNFTKIAQMFKCSAKQIRCIVKDKEQIMSLYKSLPETIHVTPEEDKPSNIRRLKKIQLLGNVMYEWFLRARRNLGICIISYKLIQNVALEAKRILNVENFFPNNDWLMNFRQKYNISESDMKVQSNDPGPTDLSIEQIIADVVVKEKKNETFCQQSSFGCNDDSSTSSMQASSITTEPKIHTSNITTIETDDDDEDPPSKHPKLEPIDFIEIESDDEDDDVDEKTDRKLPIKTIDQALDHLKPLEDFALIQEDYRLIGLISQLEIILKSSKSQ